MMRITKVTQIAKQDYQTKPNKMKATLIFNLPEDAYAYEYTLNASRYRDALAEIMHLMRSEYKYGEHSHETSEKIAELYDRFGEITEGLLNE
jgi:hypothetical protein